MSSKDLDKIFGSIKKALNPELGIPVDEKDNPVNYRINRLRELSKSVVEKQKDLTIDLEKINDNLSALLQELNPSETPEKKAKPKKEDSEKD